jgi:hypothetical protein
VSGFSKEETRRRAEANFKSEEAKAHADSKAVADYEAAGRALIERTARLKAPAGQGGGGRKGKGRHCAHYFGEEKTVAIGRRCLMEFRRIQLIASWQAALMPARSTDGERWACVGRTVWRGSHCGYCGHATTLHVHAWSKMPDICVPIMH